MSTLSLRVTVIDVTLPAHLDDDLRAWIVERCPDAIVEVRRTITSEMTRPDMA